MAWPKGRPKSEAQRKKLSEALKGRTKTDEHRNKIAAATKARWDRKDPALIAAREAATDSRRLPLGSRTEHADGYWLVKTEKGWELEHRLVMSRKLGRPLLDYEIVHHLDENKKNNDPKNLELTNHQEHSRKHQNFRK
jgi:hypothetical protein